MSMKENLIYWAEGVEKADSGDNAGAMDRFSYITEPFARIYYNMAAIQLRLGNINQAENYLRETVKKDPHLAIGYFLKGAVYLQLERYHDTITDCESCLTKLRGNLLIDYKQLGMQHKLYACEVHYNLSYAHMKLGNSSEAISQMRKAKKLTEDVSETRHQVIPSALENLQAGRTFQPFKLPKGSPLFKPPRSKTENLERKNFLGQSKVVSSVQHNDNYTGFVGIQDRSPSASPSVSPQPVRRPISVTRSFDVSKPPKPSMPPPQLNLTKKHSADSSARLNPDHLLIPRVPPMKKHSLDSWRENGNFKPSDLKAQKPISPPMFNNPVFASKPAGPPKKSLSSGSLGNSSSSDETTGASHLTIKVHYTTTRAIRVACSCTFKELLKIVCNKFEVSDNALSLWYKHDGELTEISNEFQFKKSKEELEDGIRLVLWAKAATKSSSALKPSTPLKPTVAVKPRVEVLRFVQALYDYEAQQDGDLSFKEGDRIAVICDVNTDWLEGKLKGVTGIFPKSFVQNM